MDVKRLIKEDRIYIWMAIFIILVNVANFFHPSKSGGPRPATRKNPVLAMKLDKAGITQERIAAFFRSEKRSAKAFRYAFKLFLFIFMAALALNAYFIFSEKGSDKKKELDDRTVSWSGLDVVRAAIVIIFSAYVFVFFEPWILKVFYFRIGPESKMMFNTFIIDIIVIATVFYFVIVRYRVGLKDIGLKARNLLRNVVSGVTAYFFTLPILLVALILSISVLNRMGYTPPPQPVVEVFMAEERRNVLFLLTLFVSLFAPFAEEIFFRGFMYGALKKVFGTTLAVFLSASVFSVLHTNVVGFLPIMILGILLAHLYEATGSLIPSITVHILHNSMIVMFVFLVKELSG